MIKIYKNKNIILKPAKNIYENDLNKKYYSVYCSKNNCFNYSFKCFSQCALHCEKGEYQNDRSKGVLSVFYRLLIEYVANYVSKEKPNTTQGFLDYIRNFDNKNESVKERIKKFLPVDYIAFQGISFPMRKNTDNFDYFNFLEVFRGIHLVDCNMYANNLIIDRCKVSFSNCRFKNYFNISNCKILSRFNIYVFEYCVFEDKLVGSPGDDYEVIEFKVFKDCEFSKSIEFTNLSFTEKVFDNEDSHCFDVNELTIENCMFSEDFKINNIVTNEIKIKKSIFHKKLEIKNAKVKSFSFIDSNVEKIFDAYKSVFINFSSYKSIFEEFAAFEYVVFGNGKRKNRTDFIYTTFKDFSNFRNTKFTSGLNFSSANLKQAPNFLNARVSKEGTDRETFRIIKNSFDGVGNKIEANRFFIKEMQAYKKELNDTKIKEVKDIRKLKKEKKKTEIKTYKKNRSYKESRRARLVFNANNLISEFGENYLRPAWILVLSAIIYTAITLWNKWYFESNKYFLSSKNADAVFRFFNEFAMNILPFNTFIKHTSGIEFISLFFYIFFAILIWQIIVSVKRHTQR